MGNFTSLVASCSNVYWKTTGGGRDGSDSNWSTLPDELLGSIVGRLSMPDHARARAVCTSWASVASAADHPPSTSHFPWLMLDVVVDGGGFDSFLSLSDARSYRFRSTGTKKGAACVGSRDGRLVIVEADTSVSSYVINPVTGGRTNLPSFCTLPWSKTFFDVRKIVVSSAAAPQGFFVAAALVYSLSCCHLAFARPGDERWTPLDFSCPPSQRIEDIVYHDSKLFVLFTRGRVQAFDLMNGVLPEASRVFGTDTADVVAPALHASRHVQLVSSTTLLRVESEKEVLTGTTTKLSVAKLDVESDVGWTEVKDLGDRSLFLDNKCSFSLSAGDVAGVRKNCVYFVDQVPHSGKISAGDLRTFDVTKGVVERLRPTNCRINDRRLMAPVWFVPSLFSLERSPIARGFPILYQALQAELDAIHQGIFLAKKLELHSVNIEGDSFTGIRIIRGDNSIIPWKLKQMVSLISADIPQTGNIEFSFCRRKANVIAHNLAKSGISTGMTSFYNSPPTWLQHMLIVDYSTCSSSG